MTNRLLAVFLVVALALAGAAPAGAVPATDGASASVPATQEQPGNETNNTTQASNASFGSSISAFMQASAADAEGEVDSGMFAAAFNGSNSTERRAALVEKRAAQMEQRIERLERQRDRLLDSNAPEVVKRAKAARLTAQINALEAAIDQTEDAATEAGVNLTSLETLRANASTLSGPEVRELATDLVEDRRERAKERAKERAEERRANGRPGNETATEGNATDAADDAPGKSGDAPGRSGEKGNASDGDRPGNAADRPGNAGGPDRGNTTVEVSTEGTVSDEGEATGNGTDAGDDTLYG